MADKPKTRVATTRLTEAKEMAGRSCKDNQLICLLLHGLRLNFCSENSFTTFDGCQIVRILCHKRLFYACGICSFFVVA